MKKEFIKIGRPVKLIGSYMNGLVVTICGYNGDKFVAITHEHMPYKIEDSDFIKFGVDDAYLGCNFARVPYTYVCSNVTNAGSKKKKNS